MYKESLRAFIQHCLNNFIKHDMHNNLTIIIRPRNKNIKKAINMSKRSAFYKISEEFGMRKFVITVIRTFCEHKYKINYRQKIK